MTENEPVADETVTLRPSEPERPAATSAPAGSGVEKPARHRGIAPSNVDDWTPPEIYGLQNRYGSSVLDEFVLGHSTSDVLTELIQNEFDAEGMRLEVAFGRDTLRVTGNGKVIDEDGWKRLSVVLGTGDTAGPDGVVEMVAPKANGIGSKNFGLRSLFLFGDRIYISSCGKMSVKDRFKGSPSQPLADRRSRNHPGVVIHVPFRDRDVGRLGPFTVEREREMMDKLLDDLQYTVVKLAQPGPRRNLATVVVASERLAKRVSWTQTAQLLPASQQGVTVVQRTVRVRDSASDRISRGRLTLTEVEFQKEVTLPEEYTGIEIPNYFRVSGGGIRLGVSVRLWRGHPDLDRLGILYYPLGLRQGFTGTAVSVNAPFMLDQDRSRALENDWNKWLLEQAADLTIDLLREDWQIRFGRAALLTLKPLSPPANPRFLERIAEHLHNDALWPTRGRNSDSSPVLRPVKKLVVSERPEFDGFLSDEQYLDDEVVDRAVRDAVRELAIKHEAPLFGLNSLIRLRCAGKDQHNNLESKLLDGQANYSYTDYPDALRNLKRQLAFATALQAVRPHLTDQNKRDLRNSPTTLAADETLCAPKDLFCVDPSLGNACPVPLSRRLHPALLGFAVVANLCNPFEVKRWATDMVQRIKAGIASPDEREALSQFVISRHGRLPRDLMATARRVPIVRDHRGDWVGPCDIVSPRTPGVLAFEPVLHFPHHDYADDRQLESKLRFRRRLEGPDLVAMAHFVTNHPEQAVDFESVLHQQRKLLTRTVVTALKDITFIRSSKGGLGSPRNLYLRNAVTVESLGEQAAFVAGTRTELYRRLST